MESLFCACYEDKGNVTGGAQQGVGGRPCSTQVREPKLGLDSCTPQAPRLSSPLLQLQSQFLISKWAQ
jgi:hypothetical protein